MQYRQPIQRSSSYCTMPSWSRVSAPTVQAETHEGSLQCIQWKGAVELESSGNSPTTPVPFIQMRVLSIETLFSTLQATLHARQSMQCVTSIRKPYFPGVACVDIMCISLLLSSEWRMASFVLATCDLPLAAIFLAQ